MDEETQTQEVGKGPKKRRLGHKKGSKAKKKLKMFPGTGGEKVKIDNKMRKLFRKRAKEYNSDDEEESAPVISYENKQPFDKEEVLVGNSSDEEGDDHRVVGEENEISEDEDGEIQPGITKFTEGCKAFRIAFKKITKKNVSDDLLGPVLSAHKKLVVEKLAEEDAERKVKGEAKKEKHLVGEKGHVKPANFLDSHEKFLIGVATKGVVKLFNAVNKAQNAQKGLNPLRSRDAKAIRKRRKEAFFSELGKTSSLSTEPTKVHTSTGMADGEGPSWAPLRDGYMLTNSKLKNWDKIPDMTVADDIGRMPSDSSSDDD
uniref:Putative RRP15-like protein n=1 Tax=Davidia involucrata TaxID=16924 RepID=A0A5B6ZL48_DAVIN